MIFHAQIRTIFVHKDESGAVGEILVRGHVGPGKPGWDINRKRDSLDASGSHGLPRLQGLGSHVQTNALLIPAHGLDDFAKDSIERLGGCTVAGTRAESQEAGNDKTKYS